MISIYLLCRCDTVKHLEQVGKGLSALLRPAETAKGRKDASSSDCAGKIPRKFEFCNKMKIYFNFETTTNSKKLKFI